MLGNSKEHQDTALTVETFVSKVRDLEGALSEASEVGQMLDQRSSLNQLRVMLNQGAETWPKYDILRAQRLLQKLEETFDATRHRLAPRRKFHFRFAACSNPSTPQEPVSTLPGIGRVSSKEHKEKETNYKSIGVQGSYVDGETLVEVSGEADLTLSTVGNDREVEGRAVVVRGGGRGAKVSLKDGSRSVRVVGLSGCVVETGNVDGSVWISDCIGCLFRTRCRQLRVHSSSNCRLFVHAAGSPVIENCSLLAFGPLRRDDAADQSNNRWKDVVDMSFLRESGSTSWTIASLPVDDEDSWVLASCK